MIRSRIIFFLSLLFAFSGCTTVLLTRVKFSDVRTIASTDSSWAEYKKDITLHYDSVSKVKQKVRDALGDPFVEGRVNTFPSDVDTSRTIVIATITGDALDEDYDWLVYKMKKQALLKGGNLIASFTTEHYEKNTLAYFLHLFTNSQVPEDVLKKVKCTGKVVYVIPPH